MMMNDSISTLTMYYVLIYIQERTYIKLSIKSYIE